MKATLEDAVRYRAGMDDSNNRRDDAHIVAGFKEFAYRFTAFMKDEAFMTDGQASDLLIGVENALQTGRVSEAMRARFEGARRSGDID